MASNPITPHNLAHAVVASFNDWLVATGTPESQADTWAHPCVVSQADDTIVVVVHNVRCTKGPDYLTPTTLVGMFLDDDPAPGQAELTSVVFATEGSPFVLVFDGVAVVLPA